MHCILSVCLWPRAPLPCTRIHDRVPLPSQSMPVWPGFGRNTVSPIRVPDHRDGRISMSWVQRTWDRLRYRHLCDYAPRKWGCYHEGCIEATNQQSNGRGPLCNTTINTHVALKCPQSAAEWGNSCPPNCGLAAPLVTRPKFISHRVMVTWIQVRSRTSHCQSKVSLNIGRWAPVNIKLHFCIITIR